MRIIRALIFPLQKVLFKLIIVALKLGRFFVPLPRPTVYSGPGASIQLCKTIGHFGIKRVLIVTDPMISKLGLLDNITLGLEKSGVGWDIYDGVEPDPSYEIIEEGLVAVKSCSSDAILAIGGGSSIDTAKVISVRATNEDKSVEQLAGILKVKNTGMPLFVIPTTAGTGSEATVAAVVSDPKTREKMVVIDPMVIPGVAALDPELMTGLPPGITAATGMDALTHAIEAYISTIATEETDNYARAAVKMILQNLRRACENGEDLQARDAMAMASFYAGLAFNQTSLGYVHAIAHQFGAFYQTPHGLANAIVLPHILDFSLGATEPRLAELAVDTGLGAAEESDRELAHKFVSEIKRLCSKLDIPEKLDALEQKDIPAIVSGALKEAHYQYPVPKYMNRDQCELIISRMLPSI